MKIVHCVLRYNRIKQISLKVTGAGQHWQRRILNEIQACSRSTAAEAIYKQPNNSRFLIRSMERKTDKPNTVFLSDK